MGYGDRSPLKKPLELATPHEIRVTMQNDQITQAITDGKFDELVNKEVAK